MKRIVMFMQDFRGGGAERVAVALCNGLVEQGHMVDCVVTSDEGPMKSELASKVAVTKLSTDRISRSIFSFGKYVSSVKPDLVIAHMTHVNIAATIASLLFGFRRKLIVVEHNIMQTNAAQITSLSVKVSYWLTKLLYALPLQIIACSSAVKESVSSYSNAKKSKISVIYNPVVNQTLSNFSLPADEFVHAFFDSPKATFVAVGSLTKQKNFQLLLKAFKQVTSVTPSNLIILGEGPEREALERTVEEFGLENCVALPGFQKNVYAFMKCADAIVLSSSWEGLPTVLIEALALGKKIVSTNCPGGSAEILSGNQFGILTEPDNSSELADAMIQVLEKEYKHQKDRAAVFTINNATRQYLDFARASS